MNLNELIIYAAIFFGGFLVWLKDFGISAHYLSVSLLDVSDEISDNYKKWDIKTLNEQALRKVQEGKTTLQEVKTIVPLKIIQKQESRN